MPKQDNPLQRLLIQLDFPRSAFWRIATDGCEQHKGPAAFRPTFYQGMEQGFNVLAQNYFAKTPLSVNLIIDLHRASYQQEIIEKAKAEAESPADLAERIADKTARFTDFRDFGCEFIITTPLTMRAGMNATIIKQLANHADVSAAGVIELIDAMIENYMYQFPVPYSRINATAPLTTISLINDHETIYLDNMLQAELMQQGSFSQEFKNKLAAQVYDYALKAAEYYYARELRKITNEPELKSDESISKILCTSIGRENLHKAAERKLSDALIKINKIDPNDHKNILAEIVNLIRTLHIDHYFDDGNGRTFIFLLKNYLLLQHGFAMAKTNHPAHFAGYSTKELVAETEQGIQEFVLYKITAAKKYLTTLSNIKNIIPQITKSLAATLASDNLIAMDQLNELYLQVNENSISFAADHSLGGYVKFFTRQNTDKDYIMKIICDLYLEKTLAYIKSLPHELTNVDKNALSFPTDAFTDNKEILTEILNRQELAKEKNVKAEIEAALGLHFTTKPSNRL